MTVLPVPKPIKYIFEIPYRLRDRICLCESPVWWEKGPFLYVNFCGKCHKPMKFLLEKCTRCDDVYIRDFIHDGRCVRPQCQLCWNCFSETGKTCSCPPHRGKNWEPIIVGPAGLNPKKYDPAKLAEDTGIPDLIF